MTDKRPVPSASLKNGFNGRLKPRGKKLDSRLKEIPRGRNGRVVPGRLLGTNKIETKQKEGEKYAGLVSRSLSLNRNVLPSPHSSLDLFGFLFPLYL